MGSDNIHAFWLSCKNVAGDFVRDWGLYMAILLLGVASFGLGRLSVLELARAPASITQAAAAAAPRAMDVGGQVVGSKTGSVYYFPWCGSAANINLANQVWFKSEDAARSAGYVPAKNCKGLNSN
ncbi:MAG: Ada metal-binding domain-containing protein [bacterium]|nr:Ada metal-binding domain-containing protein [bacterium]